jgi:hypothetical protein
MAALLLAGSLMHAQCQYFWFSQQQARNIRIDKRIHCQFGKDRYEQNPCFAPDPVVRIHGKQRKYTEASNTPKPMGAFTDYKLIGVICKDKNGLPYSAGRSHQ